MEKGQTPASPLAWLAARGAQSDVLDGLRSVGHDWATLWARCPRGDWLLGIAERLGVEHVLLVRAAIGCARTAVGCFDGPEAARVLDAAERWTHGAATHEHVSQATTSLGQAAARVHDPAADAALRAAEAVGLGVADADMLSSAAAFAAEATVMATLDHGFAAAMGRAHGACADAVRAAIPWSEVERCTNVA